MSSKKRKLPTWLTEESEDPAKQLEVTKNSSGVPEDDSNRVADINGDGEEEEIDDYLNMSFDDPKAKTSSLTSQRERQLRERQDKARQKPQAGSSLSAKEGAQAIALQKSLLDRAPLQPPSKALKMMQRMGYTAGTALGSNQKGLVEPLQPTEVTTRSGLGLDNQKRRDIQDAAEVAGRKIEEEQTEYRQNVRTERDEKRIEGRIHAAQRICETLDTKAREDAATLRGKEIPDVGLIQDPKEVNVLWRSMVVSRRQRERERSMKEQMLDAATTFSNRQYNDDELRIPGDSTSRGLRRTIYEEDAEDEIDDELEDFESLDAQERLDKILFYLRDKYHYCFWCGCQYSDAKDLENCPGVDEDSHE